MKNATILYYSSCQEDPNFENRIIENLLKVKGDLPIISITQKPMELGYNICVGDVGVSGFNMFRQVQIGLKEVKTEFVISAEADCLYPEDYFIYRPPTNDKCYRNSNLYVMPDHRDYFFHKGGGATHAQIIGKEFYLDRLNYLFKGAPEWSVTEKNFPKERYKRQDIFEESDIIRYRTENPVFQVKTHRGMRCYTSSDRTPILSIPYWGDGKPLREFLIKGVDYEKPF